MSSDEHTFFNPKSNKTTICLSFDGEVRPTLNKEVQVE
jgi:hypothetical protein